MAPATFAPIKRYHKKICFQMAFKLTERLYVPNTGASQ